MGCTRTVWPESPLVDCDGSTYFGRDMGLYGENSNVRPPAIEAAMQAAIATIPTDQTVGIVFMGQSTSLTTYNALLANAAFIAAKRPNVVIVNAAHGGYEMEEWANPATNSGIGWQYLQTKWAGSGITPAQVYAVVMINTFPVDHTNNPTDVVARLAAYESRIRTWRNIVKLKLPNTKVLYAAGLHPLYGGGEPWLSYETSLAWRAAMLAAPLPNDPPLLAPVYQWSKGATPNAQGTAWACPSYYLTDGIHHSVPTGADYAANLFLPLFLSDSTMTWFRQ